MILGLPLAVWFGMLTITSAFVTFSLGIAMHVFNKNVFKFHMTFAFTTISLALIHVTLVILLLYYGVAL